MTPRLLVLGAGAVVSEYYAPALRKLGWQREAVIVDPSPNVAFPGMAVSETDFRAALSDEALIQAVDAVVVALPNNLHEEASLLALERGLHVLCEKPLAPDSAACRRLSDAAERADRTLAVGMVRRLLPGFCMLKQALQQQLVGNLISVEVDDGEPYAWPSESGAPFRPENGGVLADMGVHYLDQIEELVGPLAPLCYADDRQGGVEANVDFELRSRSGVRICLRLSRTRTLRNTLVCRGERGELSVAKNTFDSCIWRSFATGSETRLIPTLPWAPTLEACFARELTDFATRIADGRPPAVSPLRAASTMALIEWAYTRPRPGATAPPRPIADADDAGPRVPKGAVCVTGATGFIGTRLVERLFGDDLEAHVVAPVRGYRTCARLARFPVELPRWDILDYAAARSVLSGTRFVFHLAYGRDGQQPERVTIQGTQNVVRAAVAAGCEAVVVLSTSYVFGQPNAEVDETYPYRPVGGTYGASKAAMERWCLNLARAQSGTRIVVLNPTCVYGPGGAAYTEMPLRMARAGTWCWIEQGRGAANVTYVDNLVDAMLLAATSPNAHGQRLIVNDACTTWRAFFDDLLGERVELSPSHTRAELRELHRHQPRPGLRDIGRLVLADPQVRSAFKRSRLGELTLGAARAVAPTAIERLRRMPQSNTAALTNAPRDAEGGLSSGALARSNSQEHRVLPPEWLADLFGPASTTFNTAKARQVLGWTPRVSLEAGLRATRTWLQENEP